MSPDLQIFKNRESLSHHQEKCLITGKHDFFLKNMPRKTDDPRVVVKKLVVPSAQPSNPIVEQPAPTCFHFQAEQRII